MLRCCTLGVIITLLLNKALATTPAADDPELSIAGYCEQLLADHLVTPDQLAALISGKKPKNPITLQQATTSMALRVAHNFFEDALAGKIRYPRLKHYVDTVLGQAQSNERLRKSDMWQTRVPRLSEHLVALQPGTIHNPEDASQSWTLDEPIWVLDKPLNIGLWKKLVQNAPELHTYSDGKYTWNPAKTGQHGQYDKSDEDTFYLSIGKHAAAYFRALLDHVNTHLDGSGVYMDFPTTDEMAFVLTSGMAEAYQRDPGLFTTNFPDLQPPDTDPKVFRSDVEAPFFLSHRGFDEYEPPGKNDAPLIVQGQPIWGLFGTATAALYWQKHKYRTVRSPAVKQGFAVSSPTTWWDYRSRTQSFIDACDRGGDPITHPFGFWAAWLTGRTWTAGYDGNDVIRLRPVLRRVGSTMMYKLSQKYGL